MNKTRLTYLQPVTVRDLLHMLERLPWDSTLYLQQTDGAQDQMRTILNDPEAQRVVLGTKG